MYRVKFIYAPYPTQYFKSEAKAKEFQSKHCASSLLEKRTFFGNWKIKSLKGSENNVNKM